MECSLYLAKAAGFLANSADKTETIFQSRHHSRRMGKDLVTVTLQRADGREAWGFRLAGGRDLGQPLSISQVS
jgi:hypothetical protein